MHSWSARSAHCLWLRLKIDLNALLPDLPAAELSFCHGMLAALALELLDKGSSHSWEKASGMPESGGNIFVKSFPL